ERFETAQRELAGDGTVDFGILDEDLQRVIIRAVKENLSMFSDGLGDASAQIAHNREVVETAYSPDAYGTHLLSIYDELLKTKSGSVRYADGQKLLDEFLNPARFNLLRT
ncbi:MAG TPA: hypothetical protein VJ904_03575, partial [Tichowtungia sp.]|nr:hypothetical protein [Tichowtungia sp.]